MAKPSEYIWVSEYDSASPINRGSNEQIISLRGLQVNINAHNIHNSYDFEFVESHNNDMDTDDVPVINEQEITVLEHNYDMDTSSDSEEFDDMEVSDLENSDEEGEESAEEETAIALTSLGRALRNLHSIPSNEPIPTNIEFIREPEVRDFLENFAQDFFIAQSSSGQDALEAQAIAIFG